MESEKKNEQTDRGRTDGPAAATDSGGTSAADYGRRMEAAEDESERYADVEDLDSDAGGDGLAADDAETKNTPDGLGAFAGSSRHS